MGADERAVPPHGSRGWSCRYYGVASSKLEPPYDIWRLTSFVISNMLT